MRDWPAQKLRRIIAVVTQLEAPFLELVSRRLRMSPKLLLPALLAAFGREGNVFLGRVGLGGNVTAAGVEDPVRRALHRSYNIGRHIHVLAVDTVLVVRLHVPRAYLGRSHPTPVGDRVCRGAVIEAGASDVAWLHKGAGLPA